MGDGTQQENAHLPHSSPLIHKHQDVHNYRQSAQLSAMEMQSLQLHVEAGMPAIQASS